MSYKEELVRRMRADGRWLKISRHGRRVILAMGEDDAREALVTIDEESVDDTMRAVAIYGDDDRERNKALREIFDLGLENLSEIFEGKLIEYVGPEDGQRTCRVTPLGEALLSFLAAAESEGFHAIESHRQMRVANGEAYFVLQQLSEGVVITSTRTEN